MKYVEIEKDNVVATLTEGYGVIICDFPTMRMIDAITVKIDTIKYFINKDGVKFFKVIDSE